MSKEHKRDCIENFVVLIGLIIAAGLIGYFLNWGEQKQQQGVKVEESRQQGQPERKQEEQNKNDII